MLPAPELLHHLLITCQQVTARARARAGITQSEYAALHHLTHNREGLTPGELGSSLALTSGSITKLVDRLEARKLAQRVRLPGADRRSVTVVATNNGTKLIEHDLQQLVADLPGKAKSLTAEERATVARLLALVEPTDPS
jgi:MarR family 2-MHQ and catechol resistance regulon transcriptional repressor